MTKPGEKKSLRKRLMRAGLVLLLLGVAGFIVVLLGIVPIKASSGHFALTSWFLNFAKERSVSTHSLFHDIDIEEPWLVMKGAGHFHSGCAPCHGGVAGTKPAIPAAMLPPPPNLAERAPDFDDEELFFIVKHGIKFTGMPAWPATGRDDEVRAVVAFLRALPKLDQVDYDAWVHGEHDHGAGSLTALGIGDHEGHGGHGAHGDHDRIEQKMAAMCARCHGESGDGRGVGAFPKLAGQYKEYLFESLIAYGDGTRHSGIMEPIVASLSKDDLRAMADSYAAMPLSRGRVGDAATLERDDAAAIERGRRIATRGVPERLVPSCAQCHEGKRNPSYPKLDGQYAEYLELQLELFQSDERGGTAFEALMDLATHKLTPQEMRDVSLYYEARH